MAPVKQTYLGKFETLSVQQCVHFVQVSQPMAHDFTKELENLMVSLTLLCIIHTADL